MRFISLCYFLIFASSTLTAQDEALQEMNKLIDDFEERISKKNSKIKQLEVRIQNFVDDKYSNEAKLQEAIQKRHFAELEISKLAKDLNKYEIRNRTLVNNNVDLKRIIKELNQKVRIQKEEISIFSKNVSDRLANQGRSSILNNAIRLAESDFYSGKSSTKLGFFAKGDPLVFFDTGYRVSEGIFFDSNIGAVVNNDKNIYLGLGILYHHFAKIDQAMMGIYLSSRISLGESFIYNRKFDDDLSLYVIGDLGYAFSIYQNPRIKGGLFTNLGIGYPIYMSENVFVDTGLTWRRLIGKTRLNNGNFTNTNINSADLRIGLILYLGR